MKFPDSSAGTGSGVVVLCDSEGVIRKVMYDGLGLTARLIVGQSFVNAISVSSGQGGDEAEQHRDKAARLFLATLRNSGVAFGWQLQVPIKGHPTWLHFTGGTTADGVLIVGDATCSESRPLVEELMRINNETVNALRLAAKQASKSSLSQDERDKQRDNELLRDLSRANNEVLTAQRELAKKNVTLSQTNAALEQARLESAQLLVERERSNLILESRVMERTSALAQTNRELQVAKEEADQANAAKSEFLSRMSHELRTPLNAILGFGQILKRAPLTPIQQESIGHILEGGNHLLALVNKILDISRVDAGHGELVIEPVALTTLVAECCVLLQPLAQEHDIGIEQNSDETVRYYGMADRQRLKQVLLNLLSNAIQYNRPGGKVIIAVQQRSSGCIQLRVQDTGPGLTPQDIQKLFTPFERLHAPESGVEGIGLGLVISRQLIRAMGGSMGLESDVGQGSTFWIELPPAAIPTQASSLAPDQQVDLQARPTYTVLCIEDNPANLKFVEAIFEMRPDWALLSAMTGTAGLELARRHEPDLILLDLNLPDMHGTQVLARIQQSAVTRDIPVIVVSADPASRQQEELINAGAKAYLTKPLDVERLLETLDEFLPGTATTAS